MKHNILKLASKLSIVREEAEKDLKEAIALWDQERLLRVLNTSKYGHLAQVFRRHLNHVLSSMKRYEREGIKRQLIIKYTMIPYTVKDIELFVPIVELDNFLQFLTQSQNEEKTI